MTMTTAYFPPIRSHPFFFYSPWCDDLKVNSSLLLFHYQTPHFKKYVRVMRDDDWGSSNLPGDQRIGEAAEKIQCVYLYKIIFMFDKTRHNKIFFAMSMNKMTGLSFNGGLMFVDPSGEWVVCTDSFKTRHVCLYVSIALCNYEVNNIWIYGF